LGNPLVAIGASGGRVVAVCADSEYIVFLIGPSAQLWHRTREFDAGSRMNEPSGQVRRERDGLRAIASRGGSVDADSMPWRWGERTNQR
jgi:hypothetical protein